MVWNIRVDILGIYASMVASICDYVAREELRGCEDQEEI